MAMTAFSVNMMPLQLSEKDVNVLKRLGSGASSVVSSCSTSLNEHATADLDAQATLAGHMYV